MIDMSETKKKHAKAKTKKTSKPAHSTPSGAMHSAASPEWGTPMLLRSFSTRVMEPAAMGRAIDLDYASSAYWQAWWPDPKDRPHAFLDGSPGRDVLVEEDRRRAAPRLGSGHLNAPGLAGGEMVQKCWGLFEQDHRWMKLGSGFWVGYSVEQFGSLQNVGDRNPLTCGVDDLITTIVPSRRAHYVLHPKDLIAVTKKKQARRDRKSKQWAAEQRLIARLQQRSDDRPVDAGAPSHLSYVSILWHRDRAVRGKQMAIARQFLEEQQADPKSLLFKYEAIGPLDLEAR
jgi:hypothetical protein